MTDGADWVWGGPVVSWVCSGWWLCGSRVDRLMGLCWKAWHFCKQRTGTALIIALNSSSCQMDGNFPVGCRTGTIQSLLVHYRYRNQPIRIDMVIMLYRYR